LLGLSLASATLAIASAIFLLDPLPSYKEFVVFLLGLVLGVALPGLANEISSALSYAEAIPEAVNLIVSRVDDPVKRRQCQEIISKYTPTLISNEDQGLESVLFKLREVAQG
jgi:hypothetical protein